MSMLHMVSRVIQLFSTNILHRAPAVPARPPLQKKLLPVPPKTQMDSNANKHGSTEAGEDDLLLLSDDDEQVQHTASPNVNCLA